MPSDDGPHLVREEESGDFGLYHPDENIIEAYVGDERVDISGEYYGVNWRDAPAEQLRASIEEEIEIAREGIKDLRGRDLTDEQEHELERLESRLESEEKTLEIVKRATDERDS